MNNKNNNSNNKSTTLKTLLMLSITSMLLVPEGIISVDAAPGDILLTINNPTPTINDHFGFPVAVTPTGDLLVSALGDDTGGTDAGSVYLFDGTDGSLLLTINNPSPTTGDQFGRSIATIPTGDVLIGAYQDSTGGTDAGSAYLFNGTDGSLLLTINNPSSTPTGDFFGRSIATTSAGDILIGADYDDTGSTNTGSAYLFDGTDGSLLLTINNPSSTPTGDRFGVSVATTPTGDLLMGAFLDDTGATDAGSAYLFDGTDGSLLLTINNPSPTTDDQFGTYVATTPTGDLLVSALGDDTGATDAGSVYLFDGTDGSLLLTINNPSPTTDDFFGNPVVTTSAGDILVGDFRDDTGGTDAGFAYLFDGTDGSLLLTINNPSPTTDDFFGVSVATTPTGDLLIGANLDDTGATDAGVVYLFEGISSSTQTDSSTTGTVEILTTCGVQFNSGAPINYGAVLPGDTSDEQTLTLYNSGNVVGDILVSGSNWIDGTSTTQMDVTDTKYSIISDNYDSKTSLSLTDTTLLTLDPQVNTDTFWQLQANLLDPLFSGSLTQTVDFSVTC